MPQYWLDSNVFIEAKDGPYSFDILPDFWVWLVQQAAAGIICSSSMVCAELLEGDDELAAWVRDRRDSGLFVLPDQNVQTRFTEIADYVKGRYDDANSALFLERADPWVIAHAAVDGGMVITHESLVPETSRKAKIPNVCIHFNVKWANTYGMLRELKPRFGLL
jgi:uncharacterized protein DUF4411